MNKLLQKNNIPLFGLAVLLIFGICAIVVSHKVFGISIVVACLMFMLEAVLAVCLNKIPLWIHGIVVIAQIVAGIVAANVVFMILMAIVYAISIIFLYIWSLNE